MIFPKLLCELFSFHMLFTIVSHLFHRFLTSFQAFIFKNITIWFKITQFFSTTRRKWVQGKKKTPYGTINQTILQQNRLRYHTNKGVRLNLEITICPSVICFDSFLSILRQFYVNSMPILCKFYLNLI